MRNWLDTISNMINSAASTVSISTEPQEGAFDGDVWLWTWYEIDKPEKKNAKGSRVAVLVHPNASEKEFDISVSAVVWLLGQQYVSDGKSYYVGHLTLKSLGKIDSNLVQRLEESLSKALQEAHNMKKHLPISEDHDNALRRKLQEKGLLNLG